MGSGTYPVRPEDKLWNKLEQIIKDLDEVYSEMINEAYDNCQFDNAAQDGAYAERIKIAIEMIQGIMRK